jgi:tryptophan synthase alpha chain
VFPITSPERDPLRGRLERLRADGRRALIPYVTAGYPDADVTARLLVALAGAGADVIELGVPFSDPVADGPTIQRASFAALQAGASLVGTLDLLRAFRARYDVPVVLFSYLNPVLAHGVADFISDAVAAGADGVLLTDLPVDADDALEEAFRASPLSFVRLVAPTTPPQRVQQIAATAQGFLYYVGRMGVTGAQAGLRAETLDEVARLRSHVALPVAVGFGVSTPAHAAALAAVADGVIVGSALIDALDAGGVDAAADLLRSMRRALDGALSRSTA